MSNLVIVAIPDENDYVWKLSSEKKPHMTLLFLGDSNNPELLKIYEFVEHAVSVWERGPFMMDVDHRGTLGDDQADVLFFRDKGYTYNQVEQFRGWLLKNEAIRKAYDSVPQFDTWKPHLTMGYPETPARADTREYPGINWVQFDRVGLWLGDYEGPDWQLEYNYDYDLAEVAMSSTTDAGKEFLEHYGVKGMRWGVRKEGSVEVAVRTDQGVVRRKTKVATKGGWASDATDDAIKAAVAKQKLKKSGPAALTTNELGELARRLQLEQQVQVLASSKGKKFVKRELEAEGEQFVKRRAKKAGQAALKLVV
jgi:2'-5' RNA ligase